MLGFGNPFPFQLGGGASDVADSLLSSVQAQRPEILRNGGTLTEVHGENMAIARAFLIAWSDTDCRTAQADPRNLSILRRQVVFPDGEVEFISMLERWERILNLRPPPTSTLQERRATVHSGVAGFVSNTRGSVDSAMTAIFGSWFKLVAENRIADVDYPGRVPPGNVTANYGTVATVFDAEYPGSFNASRPWHSGVCHLCVHFQPPAATSQVDISRKVSAALLVLDGMLPAYMSAAISQWAPDQTAPGFYAGISLAGLTAV